MMKTKSTRSLREILEDAETAISRFKNPDSSYVAEARERLNEILIAGNLGDMGEDQIEYLSIGHEKVYIVTRYSVRSCEQEDRFEFPVSVIDAEDPIAAIKAFGRSKKITEARRRFAEATQEWTDARDALEEALKS